MKRSQKGQAHTNTRKLNRDIDDNVEFVRTFLQNVFTSAVWSYTHTIFFFTQSQCLPYKHSASLIPISTHKEPELQSVLPDYLALKIHIVPEDSAEI